MSVEQTVKAIEANTAAFKVEATAILGNGSLTDAGRRQQLGAAYDAAQDRHYKLFNAMRATVETERRALTDALLTGSGDDLSKRDAADRARQAKNGKDLRELVAQAALTTDQLLLRAVSYEAVRRHLWDVVGAAADAGFRPAANLLAFEQIFGVLQSTEANFAFKVRTTGPARLAGM